LRYCARESSRPECSQWWRGNVAAASLREVAKPCGARCGQEERQEIQGLAFGFGHRDCAAQWPFDRRKIRSFQAKADLPSAEVSGCCENICRCFCRSL